MSADATNQRFQCTHCPKSYKYASGLSRHIADKQPESTSSKVIGEWLICRICLRIFASVKGRKIHEAKCGKNTKNFEPLTSACKKCEKTFSQKASRDKHQKISGRRCRGIDPPPCPSGDARPKDLFTNRRKGGSINGLKWQMKRKI